MGIEDISCGHFSLSVLITFRIVSSHLPDSSVEDSWSPKSGEMKAC